LRAATDTEIEVTRDNSSGISAICVTKQRDYPTDGSLSFSLQQVALGSDADGDEITSCVVNELTDRPQESRSKGKRLSYTQVRALNLLENAIAKDGQVPPTSEHIPAQTACVGEEVWRRYCDEGSISKDTPNAKRVAFNRAASTLITYGRVGKWGDRVWLIRE
jgi:hypothetical protein